jgi:hypothetical protein
MTVRNVILAWALAAAFLSVGCGSSSGDGSGGSGGGGEGGAGGQAAGNFDLYACTIAPACAEMLRSGSPGNLSIKPAEALVCAGRLVASGERGLLKTDDMPGPLPPTYRKWIYVLGDGTAIVQDEGPCQEEACTGGTLGPHERCNIEGYDELVANCDPLDETDPDCSWDPFGRLVDCQAIDEQDCESVVAFQVDGGE